MFGLKKAINVFQTAKIYFSEKNILGFKGHFKPNFSHTQISSIVWNFLVELTTAQPQNI